MRRLGGRTRVRSYDGVVRGIPNARGCRVRLPGVTQPGGVDMEVVERKYEVEKLVDSFVGGSLQRNPEYQRGAAWKQIQQQGFIDSLLRGYPVPALFLHRIVGAVGLDGSTTTKWDIVDGQQRLIALRDFVDGKYPLQPISEDSKLRLPKGVREQPADWAGKGFHDLSPEDQQRLKKAELTVFEITHVDHADEIRDLFIRLQAGTALSRQQIRDAWPGSIGPFIESLAGKLDRRPSCDLFSAIDKRGARWEDDDDDAHVADRQLCAQLLLIFLERMRDAGNVPSVSAGHLDTLYHQHTDFDRNSDTASCFTQLLTDAARILERARELRIQSGGGARRKFRRFEVVSLFMFLHDVNRAQRMALSTEMRENLSRSIANNENEEAPAGKGTSGRAMEAYYRWWREHVASGVAAVLDAQRLFSEKQKAEIRERDRGVCQVCGQEVGVDEGEFDHFPILYRNGGPTVVENGRLVHSRCHPRGRPPQPG